MSQRRDPALERQRLECPVHDNSSHLSRWALRLIFGILVLLLSEIR